MTSDSLIGKLSALRADAEIESVKNADSLAQSYWEGIADAFTLAIDAIAVMGDASTRKDEEHLGKTSLLPEAERIRTSPAQTSEIPDNYDLTQRIEESLAYFCDEFPKGNYPEVWSKPVSRFSGGITPDDLQAILSILCAPKPVSGNISPAALTWATTLIWLRDILDNYCPHVWREKEGTNFKAVLDAAGVAYGD